MKRFGFIVSLGLLCIVMLIVWFGLADNQLQNAIDAPTATVPDSLIESVTEIPQTISGQATIADLFRLQRSFECAFQFKDTPIATEGAGFFDGEQLRVDSMYQGADQVTYTANMISDGSTLYVWSETEQGSRAIQQRLPPEGVTGISESIDQATSSISPQSKVAYDCKPWNVDGSVFLPPSTKTF